MIQRTALCWLILLLGSPAWSADVPVPIATDSRIKTFVYSENDVFSLVTHYGYESNIEFGLNEEIETISVGDRVGWQIVPTGRRLFIRAMAASARTNMTVVTNKHAYQFDLASVPAPVANGEELVYVVRFFYPDDKANAMPPPSSSPVPPPSPMASAVSASVSPAGSPSATPSGANYNYTFTGDASIAPLRLFDDGRATYFKFPASVTAPKIAVLTNGGREIAVTPVASGEYWVVRATASRFTVRDGSRVVCVYNESAPRP